MEDQQHYENSTCEWLESLINHQVAAVRPEIKDSSFPLRYYFTEVQEATGWIHSHKVPLVIGGCGTRDWGPVFQVDALLTLPLLL